VQSFKRKVAEERSTDQVRSLSSDLKKLASTCHKAFEVAGLINSKQEAVKDTVELCKLHLPQPKESRKWSSAIAHLWKKPTEETHSSKDPVKLANICPWRKTCQHSHGEERRTTRCKLNEVTSYFTMFVVNTVCLIHAPTTYSHAFVPYIPLDSITIGP
jgi:hypothetical protein